MRSIKSSGYSHRDKDTSLFSPEVDTNHYHRHQSSFTNMCSRYKKVTQNIVLLVFKLLFYVSIKLSLIDDLIQMFLNCSTFDIKIDQI